MADGLLIQHPSQRNVTLLLSHPGVEGRKAKDYWLRLDENGRVIVSETVWLRVQQADARHSGESFVLISTVGSPPAQGMGSAGDPIQIAQTMKTLGNGDIVDHTSATRAHIVDVIKGLSLPGMIPDVRVKPRN